MVCDIYLAFANFLIRFSSPLSAFRSFKYIRQHWQFGIEIVVCSAFITPKSFLECNTPVNFLMCHFLFIGVIFVILWVIIYTNIWVWQSTIEYQGCIETNDGIHWLSLISSHPASKGHSCLTKFKKKWEWQLCSNPKQLRLEKRLSCKERNFVFAWAW